MVKGKKRRSGLRSAQPRCNGGTHAATMRHQPVLAPDDPHEPPLEALGAMQRAQVDLRPTRGAAARLVAETHGLHKGTKRGARPTLLLHHRRRLHLRRLGRWRWWWCCCRLEGLLVILGELQQECDKIDQGAGGEPLFPLALVADGGKERTCVRDELQGE